jgi:ubiquinone/menaquinone biosynthesis C-methylase UbiE
MSRRLGPLALFTLPLFLLVLIPTAYGAPPVFIEDETPAGYDSLQTEMDAAVERGDLEAALTLATRMAGAVQIQHMDALYALARIHALLGEAAKAYHWLAAAVDAGYWDMKKIREDEAFAAMRQDEYFKTLSRAAWANGYLAMLERDQREDFQKKKEILETLAFKPGERVADLGAGSGYFTIPIAQLVGPTGKVWAIDAVQNMLDYIQKRLWAEKLDNVELVKVEKDDPQLPPGGVDTILMVDTFHYITERTAYGEKLRAGLAPGGRLVVIDYIPKSWEERPWGPPPSQHLSREQLSADLAAAGLKEISSYDFLPEQFFVVYGAE